MKKDIKLCSACLLGVKCRYDGRSKANKQVLDLAKKSILIPVCPEQLAGFPVPRDMTEMSGAVVVSSSGKDLSKRFTDGARETLRIAKLFNVKEALLKQRSPSCGCGQIYDGTFTKTIIEGNGVTAQLLLDNGIKVITEEDL